MDLAQIDMIYSLLSMLNTDDKEHISRTLLGMSTCRDSCMAMRQAGCMSLLVQLIHGCPDSSRNPGGTGSRVARQRAAAALHNLVHCLPDEKWQRREARVLKLLEIVREYSDNQQQRILANNNLGSQQANGQVDAARVGPAVMALMKLSFDEDHRHAITVLGGLQAISELLVVDLEMFPIVPGVDPSPLSLNIRRFGCMALTNLTFGDVTNKSLLCSMPTTLKAVVALLGFLENEDIVQAAGSVLRNLSWSADPPSKIALREAGAVKQLVRSVMSVKRESTRTAVFSALWNVSAHLSENKADICSAENALDFIAYSLTSPGSIGESAGGALRNISSHIAVNAEYRQILRRRGCLEILVNQLKSNNLTTISNACGALWNLSAKCPEDQQTLWELGAVQNLQALTSSKHQMIATAAAAAIRNLQAYKQQHQAGSTGSDQQHYLKQSTSKSVDNADGALSSSFPGTGRLQSGGGASTAVSSSAYMTGQSQFVSMAEKPGVGARSQPNAPAVKLTANGGGGSVTGTLADTRNGPANKSSVLYSDTPNSNVVHLNYLHMLATRTGQPQQLQQPQQSMQPPQPPQQTGGKRVADILRSPPPVVPQRPSSARLPNSAASVSSNASSRVVCVPTENVSTNCAAGAIAKGSDFGINDNDDEDEQPTNFGQRFQETEVQDHRSQKSVFSSGNVVGASNVAKSGSSPTDSAGSGQNNENKLSIAIQGDHQNVSSLTVDQKASVNKGQVSAKQQQQPPSAHVTFAPHVETVEQTPMMFSRRSSVDSLNSVDVPSIRSEVVSEYSRLASGAISPTDLPESPGAIAEELHQQRLDHQHQQHMQHMQQQTGYRGASTGPSVFATPQQHQKARLLPSLSAPLASAEESFPAMDTYADESERPVVYATEDTPAILSHATSLSNLTTPGFETPGGAFSPVRAIGGDRPVSPPTAAGMRLFFRKPVEPEPMDDEVNPYYTEDTPCHLSASSSLSSLSVMSRASSTHRSAAGTPLRQKLMAISSAITNPGVYGSGGGATGLHPRVVAAAARNADPYVRHSPFMVPVASVSSPFVVASPQTRPRPAAVLLEESEDSHNISGLSSDNPAERSARLEVRHRATNDSDESVASSSSDELRADENLATSARKHEAFGNDSNPGSPGMLDDEDAGGHMKKDVFSGRDIDVDEEDLESETEDIIQQLIETALESPKKLNESRTANAIGDQSRLKHYSPLVDQSRPLSDENLHNDIAGSNYPSQPVDHMAAHGIISTDLDSEPTAKELEMLEECINLVLTPERTKPATESNTHQNDYSDSSRIVVQTQSPHQAAKTTDSNVSSSSLAPGGNTASKVQRNTLTVISAGAAKVRSPQKSAGSSDSGDGQHHFAKGSVSYRGKSSSSKVTSAETSPSATTDIGRSSSPGSVSRGGSSSGGGSTTRHIALKKVNPMSSTKRSPTVPVSTIPTSSSKKTTQPRRSRSRGEVENACLSSPVAASNAPACTGTCSASKVSPSSSSTTSSHNKLTFANNASSNLNQANSKRWNFSTKPNPLTSGDGQSGGKGCCKHHVERQQPGSEQNQTEQYRSSSSTGNSQQRTQQPIKKTTTTAPSSANAVTDPIDSNQSNAAQQSVASTGATNTGDTSNQASGASTTAAGGKTSRRVLMTTV